MKTGLPADIWWLLRVQVGNSRDCVPFECWILWHRQFLICQGKA